MEATMRVREIRGHVDRRPFRPFHIFMSDGTVHTVSNPDLVFLMKDTVILGILEEGEDFPDHSMYCDAVHITRVETLAEPSE